MSHIYGQNRLVSITSKKEFEVRFEDDIDNTQPVELSISYKNDNGKEELILIHEGIQDTINEITFTSVQGKLNASIIHLNTQIHNGQKICLGISIASMHEIFIWIKNTLYGESDRPIAGSFIINSRAPSFKNAEEPLFRKKMESSGKSIYNSNYNQINNEIKRLEGFVFGTKLIPNIEAQKIIYDVIHTTDITDPLFKELKKIPTSSNSYNSDDALKLINVIQGNIGQLDPYNINKYTKIIDLYSKDYVNLEALVNSIDNSVPFIIEKNKSLIKEYIGYKILSEDTKTVEGYLFNKYLKDPTILSPDEYAKITDIINTKQIKIIHELGYRLKDYKVIPYIKDIIRRLQESLNTPAELPPSVSLIDIERIDLQIERGFIENVKVIGSHKGISHIFENSFAIGFTSKKNYKEMANTKLFDRSAFESLGYIRLGDVIHYYDNAIYLFTRDYSPADTFISVKKDQFPMVDVYKAKFSNLFDIRIYTDLAGLKDANPNGVIQTEISRRFNILTERYEQRKDMNMGFLNYFFLYGSLNKIEDDKKYLELRNKEIFVNNTLVSPSYATTLDILKYRMFTLGGDINLFVFDLPTFKSMFTIDLGSQYSITPLREKQRNPGATSNGNEDTPIYTDLYAHMFTWFPKIGIELFSERRVGFSWYWYPQFTKVFTDNRFKPVASYAKSDLENFVTEPTARWTHMFETNVRVEINREGSSEMFLRSRLYWQHKDINSYFPQIQIGYSFLFKVPKK